MKQLSVDATEEIELLLKLLGPVSSTHARNIKISNVSNPVLGLKRQWERLDDRYGCSGLVEEVLKRKLDRFPKLSIRLRLTKTTRNSMSSVTFWRKFRSSRKKIRTMISWPIMTLLLVLFILSENYPIPCKRSRPQGPSFSRKKRKWHLHPFVNSLHLSKTSREGG